jgi:TIR domain
MGSIFLSYRREDAEGQAGRLYDDLVAVFGSDSVFMDVSAIQPGRDFRKAIDQSLSSCGVFLSLIGKNWLTSKDISDHRRLDDSADFVRIETATALKRDIPVIPVLVQGASIPKPDQLPDDLKELSFRNAVELTHSRWDSDVQVLIASLRPLVSKPNAKPEPEVTWLSKKTNFLALAAVGLLVVVGLLFYLRLTPKPTPSSKESAETTVPPTTNPTTSHPLVPEPTKHRAEKTVAPRVTKDPGSTRLEAFSLGAEQKPLANNPNRYTYTLSLRAPAEVVDDISRVHYDFVLESNPLSIDGGTAPAFTAVYEGWGCYPIVDVIVYFKSLPEPKKKTFNMCDALNRDANRNAKY